MSEAVSPYSVEIRIADGVGVDGNSHASDTELSDTYHQAQRDYDAAGAGARAQAFITMLVAERVFHEPFWSLQQFAGLPKALLAVALDAVSRARGGAGDLRGLCMLSPGRQPCRTSVNVALTRSWIAPRVGVSVPGSSRCPSVEADARASRRAVLRTGIIELFGSQLHARLESTVSANPLNRRRRKGLPVTMHPISEPGEMRTSAEDPMINALRQMTTEQLLHLGEHQVVYLRAGTGDGEMRFVLFGADGTPLAQTDALETAVEMAAERGSHSSRSIELAMSVIAIQAEPHRVTRMFFDCCNATADRVDQRRIEVAIEHSNAIAEPEHDAPEFLLMAAA